MKTAELKTAKFLLKKVDKEYPSLFRNGKLISSYSADSVLRKTNPTRELVRIYFVWKVKEQDYGECRKKGCCRK